MTQKDKEYIYENYFDGNLCVICQYANLQVNDFHFIHFNFTQNHSYRIIGYDIYKSTLELYDNFNNIKFANDSNFILDINKNRLEKLKSI